MHLEINIKDSIDELINNVAGTSINDEVSITMCSVDKSTSKVAEWVQDHSETRKWIIQSADVATFTKDVLSATVDAASPSEITFIHIQAISLPATANEGTEPVLFNWSIDTGAGAVAMGALTSISLANLSNNAIQALVIDSLQSIASRKVLVTCTVGINK